MTLQDAIAFLTFAFVAAITPGPSNVMLTAAGATVGIVRGLPCLFGVSLGMGALMLFVALGLGQLLMQHPILLQTMNWIGIAFLIWLAWKIAGASSTKSAEEKSPVGFVDAALFQWINPKSWIVSTGAVSAYFRPHPEDTVLYAFTVASLFVLAALPSNLVWLTSGALLERFLTNPKVARSFNLAMAVLLALSTILLLL